MRSSLGLGLLLFTLVGLTGWAVAAEKPAAAIQFRDITDAAGLRFLHNTGAIGKKYLPETMGSGVAFIDFDIDGWQDIFFVNGTDNIV